MALPTQRIWEDFSGQLRQFIRSRIADDHLTTIKFFCHEAGFGRTPPRPAGESKRLLFSQC